MNVDKRSVRSDKSVEGEGRTGGPIMSGGGTWAKDRMKRSNGERE